MKVHGIRAYIEPTPVPKMPAGLVELMEGLSREVLKNNPTEVYKFCAQHMRDLLVLRDGKPPEKYLTLEQRINKANKVIKRRAEERRRNFDSNMRLHTDQDNIEKSFCNDVEIAPIGINSDNLNTSKEDWGSREENQDMLEHNIEREDGNLDAGTHVKGNGHITTYENVVDEINTEIKTKADNDNDNINIPVCDTPTDAQDYSHTVNQDHNNGVAKDNKIYVDPAINDDKIVKVIYTNGDENDSNKIVQEIDKVENNANSDLVPSNIPINKVPNVEVCEFNAGEIDVKEEEKSKLGDDSQFTAKKVTDLNNILDAHDTSEQNFNDNGDFIKKSIVITPLDSLKDSEPNIEKENEVKDHNLQLKYTDVEDIGEDAKENDGTNNLLIETKLQKDEIEVDNNILERKDDLVKETAEDTVLLNQPEVVEKDCQINNFNQTEENDTKAIIIEAGGIVAENEKQKQEIETANEPLCEIKIDKALDAKSDTMIEVPLVSEQKIDEVTNCKTDKIKIDNDETKEDSDMNKLTIDQKYIIITNIESEQQEEDNTNDVNSTRDSSRLSIKESDDIESNDSNEAETMKLKSRKSMDLETAAITIQKVFRNFLFRSKTSSFEEPTNIEFNMFGPEPDAKDETDFTLHSQNKDRRAIGISRMDTVLQTVNEEKSLSLSTDDSSTISSAATVIQAHIRGFLCRNRLNRNKVTSSASLNTSKDSSPVSSEVDPDLVKNKTILNIHIVPEGGQFVSRDESILTSMELSLDGSPPTSANLHPLGYDKSERRKQLKREDAIQSISPPTNNSRLSEEQDSVKEVIVNEVEIGKAKDIDSVMPHSSEHVTDGQEQVKDVFISDDKKEAVNEIVARVPADSEISITISNHDPLLKNDVIKNHSSEEKHDHKQNEEQELVKEVSIEEDKTEIDKELYIIVPADSQNIPIYDHEPKANGESVKEENDVEQKSIQEVFNEKEKTHQKRESEQKVDSLNYVATKDNVLKENEEEKSVTEISSDELDVVTPFTPEEKLNDSDKPKLLHSGEFHDVVLPTKVSRNDTSVASDFHNVLVYFLVWNN